MVASIRISLKVPCTLVAFTNVKRLVASSTKGSSIRSITIDSERIAVPFTTICPPEPKVITLGACQVPLLIYVGPVIINGRLVTSGGCGSGGNDEEVTDVVVAVVTLLLSDGVEVLVVASEETESDSNEEVEATEDTKVVADINALVATAVVVANDRVLS